MNRTSHATATPGRDTSVRAAVERLTGSGFRDAFSCERGGIRSARTGRLVPTDRFRVVEELRFDGASDPDQQVLLLALDGGEEALRGTLLVTHGHTADACQAMPGTSCTTESATPSLRCSTTGPAFWQWTTSTALPNLCCRCWRFRAPDARCL